METYNLLIIEDEPLSAERLSQMLAELMPKSRIVACLDSVRSATQWLSRNPHPHLAFFDIQLSDGISFEIFEQVSISFPVVFTTAFNEYAIKAFKVNSIDYLLKPLDKEELLSAIQKFEKGQYAKSNTVEMENIAVALNQLTNSYKSRFLVKVGEHLKMVDASDISCFYAMDKAVFVKTNSGNDYALDFTLDQISSLLDPKMFFRVSRGHIISLKYIADVIAYSGSRFKVRLSVGLTHDIIVAREKVKDFKVWLEG